MKSAWRVVLVLALGALVTTSALADNVKGRIGLGLGGGIYGLTGGTDSAKAGFSTDENNAKMGMDVMPISLRYGLAKFTTLEARFSYGWNKSKLVGEENYKTTVRPLVLNLIFPLSSGQFAPYVHIGGGALIWSNTVKDSNDQRTTAIGTRGQSNGRKLESTDGFANAGVGFEYYFGGDDVERHPYSFDARFSYGIFGNELTDVGQRDNNSRIWSLTAGLNWWSKGNCSDEKVAPAPAPPPPAPAPAPPPPPAPAPPAPAPPPPPAPEPPKGPCLQEGSLEGVYFDFDKSVVKPEFNPTLNDLIDKMTKDCTTAEIMLIGHTDSKGTDAYNMKLGQRRADAVKQYMVEHGVAASRLGTSSMGESEPVAPNTVKGKDSPEGRAKNRRVVIKITKQ